MAVGKLGEEVAIGADNEAEKREKFEELQLPGEAR